MTGWRRWVGRGTGVCGRLAGSCDGCSRGERVVSGVSTRTWCCPMACWCGVVMRSCCSRSAKFPRCAHRSSPPVRCGQRSGLRVPVVVRRRSRSRGDRAAPARLLVHRPVPLGSHHPEEPVDICRCQHPREGRHVADQRHTLTRTGPFPPGSEPARDRVTSHRRVTTRQQVRTPPRHRRHTPPDRARRHPTRSIDPDHRPVPARALHPDERQHIRAGRPRRGLVHERKERPHSGPTPTPPA